MKDSLRFIIPFSTLIGLAACSESEGNVDNSDRLEEYAEQPTAEEREQALASTCGCWEAFQFASEEDCRSMLEPQPLDEACVLEAYKLDADASIAHIECFVAYAEETAACTEPALETCDADALLGCSETVGLPDCPALPADVSEALADCRL